LNGNAFYGLINLKDVNLIGNMCIDQLFEKTSIGSVNQAVSEKCSFIESQKEKFDEEVQINSMTDLAVSRGILKNLEFQNSMVISALLKQQNQ
jgi:hypothetical protein